MTERLRLAPIHLCDSFRNPALTAKMVATLDIISDGRFILFASPAISVDPLEGETATV